MKSLADFDEHVKSAGDWKHIEVPKRKDDRHLIVHVAPYSETSLGFKKSVDETYSGSNMMVDHANVRSILS